MDTVSSFTSRRPAAGALPAFTLPPPTGSEIPRAADGISPSLSSVNTGSSQSSQPATNMQYTYTHGGWPTPGSSSYGVHAAHQHQPQHQQPLGQHQYAPRPPMYSQSPSMSFPQRNSQSPATGGESLPAPPYDHVHQPFQTGVSGGGNGQGHHHPSMSSGSQPPTPSGGPSHLDSYVTATRPPSGSNYYATSPYHQQSPTHASPHSSAAGPRSLTSMAGPGSGMAPPAPYRQYQPPYQQMHGMQGGPIMSNVHQPGGQMSMLPAMNGMNMAPGYAAPPMMYGNPPPPAQADRPFKCDQCVNSFSRNHDLKRHKRIHLSVKPFPCTYCSKSFSRKDALKRHRLVKGCENNAKNPSADDGASEKTMEGDDDYAAVKKE